MLLLVDVVDDHRVVAFDDLSVLDALVNFAVTLKNLEELHNDW